ncbi:MAG: hypothetical protein CMI09_15140 [Oceanospirillaceae bacterium]|nr:hypothetical protein [Oceanospirillaceae bacterium]
MASVTDLEIYLLKPDVQTLKLWLEDALGTLESTRSTDIEQADANAPQRWVHSDSRMLIVYTPKADGNFGCLWFKTNQTPWQTDLDCARSAHAALAVEVRCAATEWSEQQQDDEPGWIKLIRGEEKPFHWH